MDQGQITQPYYRAEEHYAELFAELRDMKRQVTCARDIKSILPVISDGTPCLRILWEEGGETIYTIDPVAFAKMCLETAE